MKYSDFFDIDPDYFPSVNEQLINSGAVDWKKFYPHETFIRLLKDAESILSRNQKLSIWVEGAYGTGKSYAVLTLKRLLDAPDSDTKEYFEKYGLDTDLYKKLQGAKNQGTILTVHRYGSSGIYSDNELFFAIQESIKNALKERNIENKGDIALKEDFICWMTDKANKDYFNTLVTGAYHTLFNGDTAEDILRKLSTYEGSDLIALMGKIFKIGTERNIGVIKLSIEGISRWIEYNIEKNSLKAIVFIWDEFMEYFQNNPSALTGFQKLAELSQTLPFHFIIVSHKSASLFRDTDKMKNKLLGRFVRPTCNIELPENMAFKLIGAALEKKSGTLIQWEQDADDLNCRLNDSRMLVMKSAKISEGELKNILPIHPFTALLLKYLSSAFDSNQRSMFDFIKNDRGEDVKGFQWFINNYGPEDDDPFLTIDMLWDFFYEKGKEHLSSDIKFILDSYNRQNLINLNEEERKIFKTVLLLQAISLRTGNAVDLFIANEKNLNAAYDGTDIEGQASRIANGLVNKELLYKKPLGQGKFSYSALTNVADANKIKELEKELYSSKKTQDLLNDGEFQSLLNLPPALRLRYEVSIATTDNFKTTINTIRNKEQDFSNKISAVIFFACNEDEQVKLKEQIKEACTDATYKMIFIDASNTLLGADAYKQYIEYLANSNYQRHKDTKQSEEYAKRAREVIITWKNRFQNGTFFIQSSENPIGERVTNIDQLYNELKNIDFGKYPLGLEHFNVIDNMFVPSSLPQGVECGAKQDVQGTFRSSNPNTKLEKILEKAWQTDNYWKLSPELAISKIKTRVESIIIENFLQNGKVAIRTIYEVLLEKPFGFMPCNFTAFILGFILKEYANETYRWTDGQISDNMSIQKLKDMVSEIIKLQNTPNSRYHDKYIVTMTEQEKAFSRMTSEVFNISSNLCGSIQQTRDRLRQKMRELTFPIWCLGDIINEYQTCTDKNKLKEIIELYCGVANSDNFGSTNEVEFANKIGKLYIDFPTASKDLKTIITKENCLKGMKQFLSYFEEGILLCLANKISDNDNYLNAVRQKFDADAANWVWSQETAEKKIREVITEYKIIQECNKINTKSITYKEALNEWCARLKAVKLSYEAIKNHVNDLWPLLEFLLEIKNSGMLQEAHKDSFLEILQEQGKALNELLNNPLITFKKACQFQLDGLTDEQIREIFFQIETGMFTRGKSEYLTHVNETVKQYKNNLLKIKLDNIWKTRTRTKNPMEWSNTHLTPILCIVPRKEVQEARHAFEVINRKNPENAEVKKAINYIEEATFFEKINDQHYCDECFKKYLIRDHISLLPNIDEVREYLQEHITSDIYEWPNDPEVERRINALAKSKYDMGGNLKALQIIENMDADKLKHYLRNLVKENMVIGIEIIKDSGK